MAKRSARKLRERHEEDGGEKIEDTPFLVRVAVGQPSAERQEEQADKEVDDPYSSDVRLNSARTIT